MAGRLTLAASHHFLAVTHRTRSFDHEAPAVSTQIVSPRDQSSRPITNWGTLSPSVEPDGSISLERGRLTDAQLLWEKAWSQDDRRIQRQYPHPVGSRDNQTIDPCRRTAGQPVSCKGTVQSYAVLARHDYTRGYRKQSTSPSTLSFPTLKPRYLNKASLGLAFP